MDSFSGIVSVLAVLIGALAMVVAFYKTNLGNATIKHQAQLIQTLTEKVDLLTTDLGEVKEKNQVLLQRNQYLEGMVTGKQELSLLLAEVQTIKVEIGRLEGIMTPMPGQVNT